MQDQEFLFQFESCRLPKEYFNHVGHLRLAWIYLTQYPLNEAMIKISSGIKHYANSLGAAHIYHETLTHAWIYLVKQSITCSQHETFQDFINEHVCLLNSQYPLQYYSQILLYSDQAKQQWLEPDLKPLPR